MVQYNLCNFTPKRMNAVRRVFSGLCGAVGAMLLALCVLAAVIEGCSTSQELMQHQLETWAPADATGLPA